MRPRCVSAVARRRCDASGPLARQHRSGPDTEVHSSRAACFGSHSTWSVSFSASDAACTRTIGARRLKCWRRTAPSRDWHLASVPSSSGSMAAQDPPHVPSGFEAGLTSFTSWATNLFPVWVAAAAVTGLLYPHLYSWYTVEYFTPSLSLIMWGTGLNLTLKEIGGVFTKQPQLLLLGMILQYTVMPVLGFLISRYWGLAPGLAIGVALVACMPGGTASNIVCFIARGEMALSVMMTTASTLAAVVTLPLLTSLLVGTLVAIDPLAMLLSTLQMVLAPVLAGAIMNQAFPRTTARVARVTPLAAIALIVLIIGSTLAANVETARASGAVLLSAVFCLHGSGFAIGYFIAKSLGLSDMIARTMSIEVGMQSSALAVVLAGRHFADPTVAAPCALSACTHVTIGSILAGIWRRAQAVEDAKRAGGAAA